MSLLIRTGLVFFVSLSALLVVATTAKVSAMPAPVLISEVQLRSTASASEEFIELYNNSDQTVDLSTYKLEYYTASATAFSPLNTPGKTIELSGNLYPHGYFLVASSGYLPGVATLNLATSLGLNDSTGAVRLARNEATATSTEDVIGWGTAKLYEGTVATKPATGKTLARNLSETLMTDTDNNSVDFSVLNEETPSSANVAPPTSDPEPTPDPDETPPLETPDPAPIVEPVTTPDPVPATVLLPLSISELLPNPASPATDDADEFVELYNPNDQEVSLEGYRVETGANYTYHYVFSEGVIPAHGYLAVFSKDTNLTLSNSAGGARLLDPSGAIVYEVLPYEDANDGEAWAYIDGVWKWTLTPTPSVVNALRLPVLPIAKANNPVAKAKSTKTTTTAKPKTTTAKTATAKKTTASKVKAASTTNADEAPLGPAPLHPSVLVGVGLLALLYAVYEYRGDIRSLVLRFQRYRDLRRNSG